MSYRYHLTPIPLKAMKKQYKEKDEDDESLM